MTASRSYKNIYGTQTRKKTKINNRKTLKDGDKVNDAYLNNMSHMTRQITFFYKSPGNLKKTPPRFKREKGTNKDKFSIKKQI